MEEPQDTNPVSQHPSLPPNYVTLSMLKERWLQRKQEEEQGKLKKEQQHGAKEEIGSGSKDGVTPTTRNQNRGKSGPGYVPRRRQESEKDRRGGESWVRKHEEAESSGSVVIGGNQEEIKEKKHWERRKPRALQKVKSPENVGKKEEIAMVVSEESGGKGKIGGELQLDGDNGGVSVGMIEVVSEDGVERDTRKGFGRQRRGGNAWRGGFRRNDNRRMNSNVHKQVGELGENEKKAEEGVAGVAEDKCEKGEKGRQNGLGQSSLKIDKSSQDLLLGDRKDGNVRMMVSGQQQNMNSKVHKQVGEFGENEKKSEEGVFEVAEDKSEKGKKTSQDLLLDDRKDANVGMKVSSQQQNMNSKIHKQVGEFGDEEKKAEEEGIVRVANGEGGRIRTGTGPWAKNVEKRFRNLSLDNRKYGNARMRMGGRAGGRWGYGGYRRVEQVENRLMWVKKGENSSGNVTESNSQEVHL